MKTFSKSLDHPEAEPLKQFKEHELSDNYDSQKVRCGVNRKLALLITVAIALGAFLMTSCDDDPEISIPTPVPGPTAPSGSTTNPIVIHSMYPTDGVPGADVTILLDNFTSSNDHPYVSFGSSFADINYIGYGILSVRVPLNLQEGSYEVIVRSNGQVATAPNEFRVMQGPY